MSNEESLRMDVNETENEGSPLLPDDQVSTAGSVSPPTADGDEIDDFDLENDTSPMVDFTQLSQPQPACSADNSSSGPSCKPGRPLPRWPGRPRTPPKRPIRKPLPPVVPADSGSDDDDKPTPVDKRFTMESIGGLEDHKAFLERAVILPIVNGDVLQNWGVHPPKGVLMYGPPGTGKTYMAKALVNELAKVNDKIKFYYRKGGDVFSQWFGQSEINLRNLFETAAGTKEAPSVIFFDEIDGLCPSREKAHTHGTEAYAAVVTCFLGLMDAVVPGETLVIGSTNRLEAVDPAVRRPGRFDKLLYFGYPDEEARKNIIKIHTSRWLKSDKPGEPLLTEMAKRTIGYSGADLEKLCHDVIYAAIEQNNNEITEKMKISPEIWLKTIANTRPMGANSFGSSIYTPVQPNKTILDLVQPAVKEALEAVSKMEQVQNIPKGHLEGTQKSFLLYTNYEEQSPTFLNDYILNGILCDDLFKNKILLTLDPVSLKNQIRTRNHPSFLAAMNAVISQLEQAATNGKEVVVVAPNVDLLMELSLQNGISLLRFQRLLQGIKGPNMILLATSGTNMAEENSPGLAPIFGYSAREIKVETPSEAHLKQFFTEIVIPNKMRMAANKKRILDWAVQQCVKGAANKGYSVLLQMVSALEQVNLLETNADALKAQFSEIFANHPAFNN